MKTLERVREDLRDIRHYYSKIEDFEKISKVIGSPLALAMVESYNKKILNAPIRLYDLYVSLYLRRSRPQDDSSHCACMYGIAFV